MGAEILRGALIKRGFSKNKKKAVSVWDAVSNMELSPKEDVFFFEVEKQRMRKLFRTYRNLIYLLSIFGESNAEKGEAIERRGSMVKCRKMSFGGEDLGKILWDSPYMRVMWKLVNTFA